jgi:hypothetical protein
MTEGERQEHGWEELRRLAHEAMGDGWHNAGFLRAFIDDDDEAVFSPEDARFIEAASPSVVLRLLDAEAGLREAAKAAADYIRDISEPGVHPYGEALERALRAAPQAAQRKGRAG